MDNNFELDPSESEDGRQNLRALSTHRNGKYSDLRRLTLENFKVDGLLGAGTYGTVWKGKMGDKDVALKRLRHGISNDDIWKERDLLIFLRHPRVNQIIGAFHEKSVYLVLDLCYDAVYGLLARMEPLHKIIFTIQLMQGLEWIHSKNIVHADLTPANLFINSANNLVIGDFGAAILLPEGVDKVKSKTRLGVAAYHDFEANSEMVYSRATDIFSAACVIFEVNCFRRLMTTLGTTSKPEEYAQVYKFGCQRIVTENGIAATFWEPLAEKVVSCTTFGALLQKMVAEPATRLTASEFLADKCLQDLMNMNNLTFENIDNDENYVTRECHPDRSGRFLNLLPPNTHGQQNHDKTFDGIYFDEEEIGVAVNEVSKGPQQMTNIRAEYEAPNKLVINKIADTLTENIYQRLRNGEAQRQREEQEDAIINEFVFPGGIESYLLQNAGQRGTRGKQSLKRSIFPHDESESVTNLRTRRRKPNLDLDSEERNDNDATIFEDDNFDPVANVDGPDIRGSSDTLSPDSSCISVVNFRRGGWSPRTPSPSPSSSIGEIPPWWNYSPADYTPESPPMSSGSSRDYQPVMRVPQIDNSLFEEGFSPVCSTNVPDHFIDSFGGGSPAMPDLSHLESENGSDMSPGGICHAESAKREMDASRNHSVVSSPVDTPS